MQYIIKHLLKILSAGVILFTFLSYVSPYVNPALFGWMAFFGTAFPWLLLANITLLLVWAFRKHRFALYHLGILLFGWQYVTGFIGMNPGNDAIPGNAVTVATHNLGGIFRGINLEEDIWDGIFSGYTGFLRENGDPDILCIQETARKFYPRLAEMMGYKYTLNRKGGTMLLSRYPIVASGDVPFAKSDNSMLWADIRIDKRLVRVYSVHLYSNRVTGDTEKVLDDPQLEKKETYRGIYKVLRKVGGATGVRAEQAAMLRKHIDACPHPVILCGDFNDTPNSYVYGLLSEGLTDTFREQGFGFGTTFAGALPFLRIDYILTDPRVKTYACRVARGGYSDHYAVVAALGW